MSVNCFKDTKYNKLVESKLDSMDERSAIVETLKQAYLDLNKQVNEVRTALALPEEDIDLSDLTALVKGEDVEASFLDRLMSVNKGKTGNVTEGSILRERRFKSRPERASEVYSEDFNKRIAGLDKIVDTIIRNVDSVSQRSAAVRGSDNETTKKFSEVRNLVNEFADTAPNLAIYKFLEFAQKELASLNSGLEDRIEKGSITSDYLFRANAYGSIYKTLDDINDMLLKQKLSKNIDKEEFDEIMNLLDSARKNYSRFRSEYMDAAREELTALLAPYNTMPYDKRRIELERQYNVIKPVKDKALWISDSLLAEAEELEQQQYEQTRAMLDEIPMDIANIEAFITSEKNQNSLLIKLFSTIIDKADMQVREAALAFRKSFYEQTKKANLQGTNNAKKYKDLLSTDTDGTYYLLDQYKPEFFKQMKALSLATQEAEDKHGKQSKEYISARRKYVVWINQNTVRKDGSKRPSDKWKDSKFDKLSEEKKNYLSFLKHEIEQADVDTDGHKSLIKTFGDAKFYRLPSVRKTDLDRILSADKGIVKDKLGDFYKVRQDDDTRGELEDIEKPNTEDFSYALTTVNNEERLLVPIHFRTNIDPKDQSLDLPTIILMNSVMSREYKIKKGLEADSNLLLDVVGEADVIKTEPVTKKVIASWFSKDHKNPDIVRIPGKESNVYKKLSNVIENRVYNITDASKGKMTGDTITTIANKTMGYTADLTLMVNWMSAIPNMFQGKIQNFIEGVGGSTFTRKDLRWAEATYWNEMGKGGFGDIGANINNSKLNLVIDHLNIMTDFSYTKHNFEKDNRFKALFNGHTLHAFNNMAEHYAQSTLMLSVMSGIKVLGQDGKYITKEGKSTADKSKGINLYEVYEVSSDGVPKIRKEAVSTDYNPDQKLSDNGMVQIQALIRKKIIDLHGQYDTKWQSTMQRYWFGKAITMFRKWMIPGFYRRWRGMYYVRKDFDSLSDEQKYYSLETRQFEEGTYTSFVRFMIRAVFPAIKEMKVELATIKWNELTDYEKSNVHKTMRELLVTSMMFTAAMITALAAKDSPDDKEKKLLYTAAYIFRRQESELMQYYSITDTLRIFRSPFASINTLSKTSAWLNQLMPWNIDEQYENGDRKGEYKAWVKTKRMIPVISQTERSAEDSFNYLENLLTY